MPNYTTNDPNEIADRLCDARLDFLMGDSDALEVWEDVSAEFYNVTGFDHPNAKYNREA